MSDDKVVALFFVLGQHPATAKVSQILQLAYQDTSYAPFDLTVIDLLVQPEKAREFKILSTPTLIINTHGREQRFIGDFSNMDELLQSLTKYEVFR